MILQYTNTNCTVRTQLQLYMLYAPYFNTLIKIIAFCQDSSEQNLHYWDINIGKFIHLRLIFSQVPKYQ